MTDNSTAEITPPITIEAEMKNSYLDYAMSVIVSRAIPDVRDGLKPVHRRIIFGMKELGSDYNKPYKKSARIVGDVMGKFHPHGDGAIYDALVRMAQNFSMRLPLVDGQGNFGSMDGDPPAAMRYTESRLAKVAHHLLTDIDKETVEFQENYDGNEKEPVVLPAEFPALLANGTSGIAVGMATNIPPHNLGELLDASIALSENPALTAADLMEYVPAPDFPTGGIILGRAGSYSALTTGRGSVILRARTHFETLDNGRTAIIASEMAFQVNKAKLQQRISELVKEGKIEGIAAMRDESDKHGVRLVIECKKDAVPEVLLNQLHSFTQMQISFGVNCLALDHGRPRQMNLRDVLASFLEFREEVIVRRTQFLLNKVRDRAHVLVGLSIAVANIDEVIAAIRAAKDPVEAREELMRRDWKAEDVRALIDLVQDEGNIITSDGRISFTETQARAILDLKLQRLTGLEQAKISDELNELSIDIRKYLSLLGDRAELLALMRSEFLAIKEEFATPRQTDIDETEFEHDIEALIEREDMVVTVTQNGYIKRVPLDSYRAQRRGGKGKNAMSTRDEDITTDVFMANTHTPVLFFTSSGKVFELKTYKLPLGTLQSKGKALVNIFPLENGETIHSFMPLPEDEGERDNMHVMFATSTGQVRRNDLSDFHNIRSNGKIAMKLDEGETLVNVRACSENEHVLLSARSGKCIRFPVTAIRVFKSRNSTGVRGIKLAGGDEVVSMSILGGVELTMEEREAYFAWKKENPSLWERSKEAQPLSGEGVSNSPQNSEQEGDSAHPHPKSEISTSPRGESEGSPRMIELAATEQFILTMTENGYGKRSSAYEYRVTNRGGSGIVNIVTSDRNGGVVAAMPVEDDSQIMLMTDGGKIIRCPVNTIRIAGRNTQGVTIFKTAKDEKVVSAIRLMITETEDEAEDGDESAVTENTTEA